MNKYHKNKIKTLVAAGRTGSAIDVLLQYRSNDVDISNEIISLSARYKNYLREKHGNLLDKQTIAIELNKINSSILHLIEDEVGLNIVFFNQYTKMGLTIFFVCIGIVIGYSKLDLLR